MPSHIDYNNMNSSEKSGFTRFFNFKCVTITALIFLLLLQFGFVLGVYVAYTNLPVEDFKTTLNDVNIEMGELSTILHEIKRVSNITQEVTFLVEMAHDAKSCIDKLGICT